MKKTTIALFAGASALAAASAFAGHHEGMSDEEKMAAWNAKIEAKFAEVDTDADGQITKEEYMAYKMAEAEAAWDDHADYLGDDGMASLDEAKAYHKAKWAEKKAEKAEHKAEHAEMHEDAEDGGEE